MRAVGLIVAVLGVALGKPAVADSYDLRCRQMGQRDLPPLYVLHVEYSPGRYLGPPSVELVFPTRLPATVTFFDTNQLAISVTGSLPSWPRDTVEMTLVADRLTGATQIAYWHAWQTAGARVRYRTSVGIDTAVCTKTSSML